MPKSAGFLTSGLAAQQLGISKRTLMRAALRGEIQPASRSPGGWARFSATDVADYAQRLSGKRAHSPSPVVQPRPTLTGTSPTLLGLTNEHQCDERRDVEAHYRFTAELTSDYAYCFELQADGQWVITWVSGAFEHMTGYALQDISLEQIQASLLYPEDAPIAAQRTATLMAGWPDVWEYRIVTKSGDIRWLRDQARPLRNEVLGRVVRVDGMAQDITASKRAAEQIRFQTGLLESVEQAVVATDLAGIITFWNRAAELLYGWAAAEVQGQHVRLITPPGSSGEQANAILQQVRAGESWTGEFIVQRRDGSTFPVVVTDSPIYDAIGELIGIVGVSLDITERKKAERAAEHAQLAAAESARLRDEQAEEARAMAKVAVALASSIEPTRLYHLILEQAAQFLPCNNACMFLLQGDWAILAAGWGEPNLPVGTPVYQISAQDRAFYWPEAGGLPRYFPDMLEVPGHIHREPWVGEHRVRSIITVPLAIDGELVGFFDVASTQPNFYNERQIQSAAAFGERVTQALRNARLYAAERAARAEAQQAEMNLRAIITASPLPMVTFDGEGLVQIWNEAAERVFGWTAEEAIGQRAPMDPKNSRNTMAQGHKLTSAADETPSLEVSALTKDGSRIDLIVSQAPLRDASGDVVGLMAVYLDVTARRQAEENLRHQASHDSLTDLPNRLHLHGQLESAIETAQLTGQSFSLLLLDLDRFKDVNDTLGHHVGDLLLRQVSTRLQRAIGASETVARLGGDEFAIVLPAADAAAANTVARLVLTTLETPFQIGEHVLHLVGSLGIAVYPEHGTTTLTLLQHADVAMYVAKRAQIGVASYEPVRDEYSVRRLALMHDLRRCIRDDELSLHYQPKVA
ncbi:MAG: hypothetical protein JWO42_2598, partial [Chloroflexi bacterium]|nr:hypothetical protein [Chloroflexota bacterium]